ncbi:TetR/AcrR family transcriptional regulator [Luteococcus peritonei]|uniref:TetR/AcrR family transcriptional regulator n=1 Tax=Luteococcus peritonei TaxID=88874 RepID=A0ABW4RUD8_9ACTN
MAGHNSTREQLLDAALQLVVEGGVAQVSHRSVEERAGAARGSTRYWFGTREALLAELVGHLAERDRLLLEQAQQAMLPAGAGEEVAHAAVTEFAAALLADREGSLARFELYLYAARRPELRAVVQRWSESFTSLGAQHLPEPDSEQTRTRAALLSATLDGLALHALAAPDEGRDAAAPEWFSTQALGPR